MSRPETQHPAPSVTADGPDSGPAVAVELSGAGHLAAAHDVPSHRNLRTCILVICFVWGMLTGFLFYVLRDHEERIEDPVVAVRSVTDGAVPEVPGNKSDSVEIVKPAPIVSGPLPDFNVEKYRDDVQAGLTPESGGAGGSIDRLPKTPYGGLTGRNVPLPRLRASGSGGGFSPEPELDRQPIRRVSGPELDL